MFKTKTSWSKTKTFIFVLEAPRDQDSGLEDYITAYIYYTATTYLHLQKNRTDVKYKEKNY